MGTGARTAPWQVAADALDVPPAQVRIRIGATALPEAPVAVDSNVDNAPRLHDKAALE